MNNLISDQIFVAIVSLTATDDTKRNWQTALEAVHKAADRGAQWIQLPEMWTYMGPYERLSEVAESDESQGLRRLQKVAKERKIVLFAGTLVEASGESARLKKYHNTHYVLGRDGAVVGKYQKIHLFNLVNAQGQPTHRESDGYLAGSSPTLIVVDGFKVALSVCYDLRFGELYSWILNRFGPFDVLVAPSAFTLATGELHWELLLRSRAVEFQCYVYAANQVGEHGRGKASFGHGMLVDPWGQVLSNTGGEAGISYGLINRQRIKEVRSRLPALANRRPDLYNTPEKNLKPEAEGS